MLLEIGEMTVSGGGSAVNPQFLALGNGEWEFAFLDSKLEHTRGGPEVIKSLADVLSEY